MQVIHAEAMGLCFGVRDALESIAAVRDPHQITVYGELVHNKEVNRRLVERGFHQLTEQGRQQAVPATPVVLVTAHGISNAERARLESAGRTLLDTTCPLVRRAHQAALRLDAEGCLVLVIGRRGHVEVHGLVGDLRRYELVESPAEVRSYSAERIGVICQTTTPDALLRTVLRAVETKNPGKPIRFVDTVCRPTRECQQALEQLLPAVDALVVVGGKNSRNTRELAETARARGVRTLQVQSATELPPGWFDGCQTVGLTAGTSTLDKTIEEVHRVLLALPTAPREKAQVPSAGPSATQDPTSTGIADPSLCSG